MGFEKYAMGENRIRGRGDFKPSMFGEVVNYLIAEAFEEGTILKLKDWVDITNKVVDATVSFDAYFKRFNDIITVAIFREEIKKIVDEYNKKIEEAKSSEETKNAEEVKCECGSVIKKKSMKKHQKTKKHINSLKK